MKIIWTGFAIENLKSIYDYYHEVAGVKVAAKIRNGLIVESKRLIKNPQSGQAQPSLVKLQQGHRYLLKDHYKLVYRIVDEDIIITDVFDTRQNPDTINKPERKDKR